MKTGARNSTGCRQAKRRRGQREIKIGWGLGDVLRFMKHVVEDFDELMLLNVPIVVIDQDARRQIVGVVTIHSRDAHQFPLDRLA